MNREIRLANVAQELFKNAQPNIVYIFAAQ